MRMFHLGLALAFLVSGAISAEAAAGKGQKDKKGSKPVHGVVLDVSKDKDKNSGTIKVQVVAHKKKNQGNAAPPVEKTFQFTDATTFQFAKHVKGQKGQAELSPATFASVQKGDRVIIQATGDVTEDVKIQQGKKKKNKN